MIKHNINGREYRVREFWSYGASRKLAQVEDNADKTECILHEMLLDADGAKYADAAATMDTIALADVNQLVEVIAPLLEVDTDPLPVKSDSGAD